jgi:hypothetical protein
MTADSKRVKAFGRKAADGRGAVDYCAALGLSSEFHPISRTSRHALWPKRHSYGAEGAQPLPLRHPGAYLSLIARGDSPPPPRPAPEVPMHYLAFAFLALAATIYVISSTMGG